MYLIICNGGVLLPQALSAPVHAAGINLVPNDIMVQRWGWWCHNVQDVVAAFGPVMPYHPGNSGAIPSDMTITFNDPADGVYFLDNNNNWQPYALYGGDTLLKDTLSELIVQKGLQSAPIYLAVHP